ncbi:MAG: putative glycolipid-binding domain-containing protein [Chloroflexota bacterium]
MTTRRVAWRRSDDVATDEHCTLIVRDGGLSLVGTVLGAEGGVPVRVEYRVLADAAGLTTAVHVRDLRGFEQRTMTLERDAKGNWSVDGAVQKALKGCTDVDLGCSPSTNTLPIRRLGLGIGAASTIKAAWIRFPELTVVKAAQTYTRLDEFTYRYSSATFTAELTVDDDGLVTSYAEWQRTGISMGPNDTEPLDVTR